MKELEYFRRQFLLTNKENFDLPWKKEKIVDYNLFYHPELEFEHLKRSGVEIYLLGFLFDYENPQYNNWEIINSLPLEKSFSEVIGQLIKYSGHFVLIYKTDDQLILMNDAAAQSEIYYDTSFTTFGSQPKLMNQVMELKHHTSPAAAEFYRDTEFLSRKEYLGSSTHAENIKHLKANNLIRIKKKMVVRYFPFKPLEQITVREASRIARNMLEGYIKAASLRYNLTMGVTGGYDSRVLFLASQNVDCKYYVSKLNHLHDKHPDIYIPKRLVKAHNKELTVIDECNDLDEQSMEILNRSVDFPRKIYKPGAFFENHIIVNGNLSEIARNCFGYNSNKPITALDLQYLYGYGNNEFVLQEFDSWLRSAPEFDKFGYNALDMSYWEERMGIWGAKAKTEMNVLGTIVYSPFCSHELLITLLSTPRKFRDVHNNRLYNTIIRDFSAEAARIPINPNFRKDLIVFLKKIKLYNILWPIFGRPAVPPSRCL